MLQLGPLLHVYLVCRRYAHRTGTKYVFSRITMQIVQNVKPLRVLHIEGECMATLVCQCEKDFGKVFMYTLPSFCMKSLVFYNGCSSHKHSNALHYGFMRDFTICFIHSAAEYSVSI